MDQEDGHDPFPEITEAVLVGSAVVALVMLRVGERLSGRYRLAYDVATFPVVVGLNLLLRFALPDSPRRRSTRRGR